MISEDVVFDRFMADLDAQIEVLSSIAGDNRILTEQLRLLLESRELVYQQAKEIERLVELLDPDIDDQGLTIVDRSELSQDLYSS
ncbi:MAG: hypothetical protein CMP98_01800 [Gammaproteobacteria bacterium]|nr:hypothetical protein [Gammaproteobacteria bacterium]OUU11594.1 MAG: hypothetical protein CBB94_01910 [Gammaproteobacteria bacterium TMED34]|tara:strand:- start:562 stop:816 length:255 start_codon:yes stop_codon:yes gene_type:complete